MNEDAVSKHAEFQFIIANSFQSEVSANRISATLWRFLFSPNGLQRCNKSANLCSVSLWWRGPIHMTTKMSSLADFACWLNRNTWVTNTMICHLLNKKKKKERKRYPVSQEDFMNASWNVGWQLRVICTGKSSTLWGTKIKIRPGCR